MLRYRMYVVVISFICYFHWTLKKSLLLSLLGTFGIFLGLFLALLVLSEAPGE
jgi:hypothetical protein